MNNNFWFFAAITPDGPVLHKIFSLLEMV